jgi:hypothetical protein
MKLTTQQIEKIVKIGKGALIAGGGAATIFVLQEVGEIDFGQFTEIVVAISAILINAVRVIIKNNERK